MEKIPITRSGYEKLKKDLEYLKKVEVPENIRAIEEARGHGDIAENAEYAAAKERQSFIQGRIQELENNLVNSKVIDLDNLSDEKIVFGSVVTIVDTETEERTTYQLVGPLESDIQQNKISVTSPIGKGLIGREVGDEVRVKTPRGMRILEIAAIRVQNGKQPG
jgi:transcription elongation factor GreA